MIHNTRKSRGKPKSRVCIAAASLLILHMFAARVNAQIVQLDYTDAVTAATASAAASSATIAFQGGVILGDVQTSKDESGTIETYTLEGPVGFLLPQGHEGGVLRLEFTGPLNEPVAVVLRQFPSELDPETILFDGKPVEIRITPGLIYQYIHPAQTEAPLKLSAIAFTRGAALSDPATCACIQVSPIQASTITASQLDELLNKPVD